jgi:YD repeat-containing protein
MRNAFVVALATLPLLACNVAVDDGAPDDNVGTSQSELANPYPTSYLIDFDHDPSGNALADGTIVDTVYTSTLGVTLSSIQCAPGQSCTSGQHAFARSSVAPNTAPNVISIDATSVPVFDARFGAIRADFASPRVWVSIDVLPVPYVADAIGAPDGQPWIQAYDASGALIASVHYTGLSTDPDYFTYHTMKVDAGSARIKWVQFSVHPSSGGAEALFGEFDNLRFNSNTIIQRNPCWYRIGC